MQDKSCFPTELVSNRLSNVSPELTKDAIEGFLSVFTDNLFEKGHNIDHIFESDSLNEAFQDAWNTFKKVLMIPIVQIKYEHNLTTSEQIREKLQDENYTKFRNNLWILEQKEGFFNSVTAFLNKHGLQASYNLTDEALTEDVTIRENDPIDRNGIVEPHTTDPRDTLKNNVKLLLATLHDSYYDEKGVIQRKESFFGLPKLVEFEKVKRAILNTVSNTFTLDGMLDKLDKRFYDPVTRQYANGYLWLDELKKKIGVANDKGRYRQTRSLSEDDIKLMTGFEASFAKLLPEPNKLTLVKDSENYTTNPLDASSTRDIVTQWKNNVKADINEASYTNHEGDKLFSQDRTGLTINRNSKEYHTFLDDSHITNTLSNDNLSRILDKLSLLGVKFSRTSQELLYKDTVVSNDELKSNFKILKESYDEIVNVLKKTVAVGGTAITPVVQSFDQLFEDASVGRVLNLARVQNTSNPSEQSIMMLTPEGENMYPMSSPSTFGMQAVVIGDAQSIKDIYKKYPYLVKSPYLNPKRNATLKVLFDENGKRIEGSTYKPAIILGIGQLEDEDGVSTKSLSATDRILITDHNIMHNVYPAGINSDKSTEFGLSLSNSPISLQDILNPDRVVAKFIDDLLDNMDAAINELVNPGHIMYFQEGIFKLGYHSDILTKNALSSFITKVLDCTIEDTTKEVSKWKVIRPEEIQSGKHYEKARDKWIKDNYQSLGKIYTEYTDKVAEDYLEKHLLNTNLVKRTQETNGGWRYSLTGLSREAVKKVLGDIDTGNISHAQIINLSKFLNLNYETARNDQHKLHFGHICYYKDPIKRYSMWHGMKQMVTTNPDVLKRLEYFYPRTDLRVKTPEEIKNLDEDRYIRLMTYKEPLFIQEGHEELAEAFLKDGKSPDNIGAEFNPDGTFKNLILDGGKPTGLVGKYINSKEADSHTCYLFDAYWNYRMRLGDMSIQDWELYKYDRAYEISNLAKLDPRSGFKFDYPKEWVTEADKLLKEYEDKNIDAPQTNFKPQYAGFSKDGIPVGLKTAGEYECYRTVKGTWKEKLYLTKKSLGIDIYGFESGQKFGTKTNENGQLSPFFGQDGQWSEELPALQEIHQEGHGKQQEFPASKEEVKGSQQKKQSLANCDDEALKTEYNRLQSEAIKESTNKLLKDAGIEKNEEGEYHSSNPDGLVTRLRTSLIKSGLNSDQADAITTTLQPGGRKELKTPFDLLGCKNAIEHMLWKNINADIVNKKQFGIPAVQTPALGTGNEPLKLGYLDKKTKKVIYDIDSLTPEQKKELAIIRPKEKMQHIEGDSITAAQFVMPWAYKDLGHPSDFGLIKGKDNIWRDENKLHDPRLFNFIGFRIPTPGRNSITLGHGEGVHDPLRGDIISCYASEYVRNDADNDGDKFNCIFPNVRIVSKDFGSKNFREFLSSHLKDLGYENPEDYVDKISRDTFDTINKAVWKKKNRIPKNADNSIEELANADKDPESALEYLTDLKRGIQAYNKKFEGNIPKLEITDDNSIKGLQNKLLAIQIELMQNKANYSNLMAPITTGKVETNSQTIKKEQGIQNAESSYTNMLQLKPSIDARQIYLTAKGMIGVIAREATKHVMCESIGGVNLTGNWNAKGTYFLHYPTRKLINEGYLKYRKVDIIFPHNEKDGSPFLGSKTDAEGNNIGNTITNKLQATLEAGKDPAIAYTGFNKTTVGTGMYLISIGVPETVVDYFLTQPAIKRYVQEFQEDSSVNSKVNEKQIYRSGISFKVFSEFYDKGKTFETWNWKRTPWVRTEQSLVRQEYEKKYNIPEVKTKPEIKKEFLEKLNEIVSRFSKVSEKELFDGLSTTSDDEMAKRDFQLYCLYKYLEYEDQARKSFNFTQYINYDTANIGTYAENKLRNRLQDKVIKDGFIKDPHKLVNTTFLGSIKESVETLDTAFKDFFVSMDNRFLDMTNKMLDEVDNDNVFLLTDDKNKILNQYQNFILNHLIQTLPDEQGGYLFGKTDLVQGSNTFAKQLSDFRRKYPGNIALQNIQPLLDQSGIGTDSVRTTKMGLSPYDVDNIVESLINSWKISKDHDLRYFLSKIATYSLLQSGLQSTRNSIVKLVPQELYYDAVKHLQKWKDSNPVEGTEEWKLHNDVIYKQFHQNFYRSPIVKVVKAKELINDTKVGNFIVYLPSDSETSNYEFLRYSNKKVRGRDADINRKAGNNNANFDHFLYQRINEIEDPERVYYRRINILGKYGDHVEVTPDLYSQSIHKINSPFDENPKEIRDRIEELKNDVAPFDSDYNEGKENLDKLNFTEGNC